MEKIRRDENRLSDYQYLHYAQQSATIRIASIVMSLVPPKAGAKHELLFNKTASVSIATQIKKYQHLNLAT